MCSDWDVDDGGGEPVVRGDQPCGGVLGIWIPGGDYGGVRGGLCVCVRDTVRGEGQPAGGTEPGGRCFPDADTGELLIVTVHRHGQMLTRRTRQLGTAFGLAMTTIVHNRVLQHRSDELGVHVDQLGTGAPRPAQLDAYKAAQWTAFAFAILGQCSFPCVFDRCC